MTTNYDGLQLPEGEVQAFINGEWKSVEFTDEVTLEDVVYLERTWPDADLFRFQYRKKLIEWNRTGAKMKALK